MPSDAVLIIGGGPAGLEAARGVGDLGGRAIMVEKRNQLGGTPVEAGYAAMTPHFQDAGEAMANMVSAVIEHPNIDLRTGTTVTGCQGELGNYTVTLEGPNGPTTEQVGSIIVATGFQHFDPGRETQLYGYYEFDDVVTIADLEPMLKSGKLVRPSNGQPPERVCFIQCVGSRDRQIGNQWCSKVCCGIACKQSIEVKHLVPNAKVFIFYIDMRTYGFWEDQLYWKAQEEEHVNFVRGIVTEVLKKGDKLLIRGEDTTMGRPMEVLMDMVVLSVGMEPSRGTKEMAKVFGLKLEPHGYIALPGEPLDTVSTSVPGIYVAGTAAGPRDLEDSISTGGAAAMKAVSTLRRLQLAKR